MATPNPALIRRAVLTPLATAKGLDYDEEMLAPSSTDEAHAFGLVACGADLLLGLTYADEFPSQDRRTTRRGVKWVLNGARGGAGGLAAVFLAQAFALSQQLLQQRAGDEESARRHRELRELIQRVYPLPPPALERLLGLDEEYRVMETHEVPERVLKGVAMGTGYHQALREPGFSDFENVDDDAQLVEVQERYADSFLRSTANLYAIELMVGAERYDKLAAKLLTSNSSSCERLVQQSAEHARWASLAEEWQRQGLRTLEPKPTEPPLQDHVAEYLRRRTGELLANPDGQMAGEATNLVKHYVDARVSQETDWNCLTDAAITGYVLRRAEEELIEHSTIAGEEAEQLRRAARSDAKGTLDGGTRHLVARLPAFFSRGASSWHEMARWARENSLERSRERRAQSIEKNEPPRISGDDCDQAFGYGYALRTVQTTIYGEDD